MHEEISLGELAVRFGLTLRGSPDLKVSHVATLSQATPGSLSFLANSRYRKGLKDTRASAVVVSASEAGGCPVDALIATNPYLAYARIASLLHPELHAVPGIHPSAVIAKSARIGSSAAVGPLTVIEEEVELGECVEVGPGCIVQRGARVGARYSPGRAGQFVRGRADRRALRCACGRGDRCRRLRLRAGSRYVGQSAAGRQRAHRRRCGDRREHHHRSRRHRRHRDRRGRETRQSIQIGHNVIIGAHTAIAACTGISGSTTVGRRCMIGGMVGMAGHLTIADDVVVTGLTMVSASIKKAGSYSSGMPAVPSRAWWRMVAHLQEFGKKER